jgi:DNA-binding CsgD family transcriptional regulator
LEQGNRMLHSNVEEAHVYIFGPLRLQNELIREFLERSTGLTCACWGESVPIISDISTKRNPLILWDCIDTDQDSLWTELDMRLSSESLLALFNVSLDLGISKEVVDRGVRGIFFENESPFIFTKGIQAILNGELWFSRDTMARCLLDTRNSDGLAQGTSPNLTSREKEILIKISSGSTNGKIAEDLYISPHTVRTHVYNIFKKINVPNRLQAAFWAAENL